MTKSGRKNQTKQKLRQRDGRQGMGAVVPYDPSRSINQVGLHQISHRPASLAHRSLCAHRRIDIACSLLLSQRHIVHLHWASDSHLLLWPIFLGGVWVAGSRAVKNTRTYTRASVRTIFVDSTAADHRHWSVHQAQIIRNANQTTKYY